jgi:hypothetical protein
MRRASGPRRFAAQMMLQLQPITDSRLSVDALRWYDSEIEYNEAHGKPTLTLDGVRMTSASAWWDPAFGHDGDGSVVAVMFTDGQNQYWLHDLAYIRIDASSSVDEATQQCRIVAQICERYYLPSVTIEINGLGKFLPSVLKREMNGSAAVIESTSKRAKDLRIIEAFDGVLAARALHVHKRVAKTGFLEEMRNWRPGASGADDGLDAVAGALAQQPVRIGTAVPRKHRQWQIVGAPHNAKTDFNVME